MQSDGELFGQSFFYDVGKASLNEIGCKVLLRPVKAGVFGTPKKFTIYLPPSHQDLSNLGVRYILTLKPFNPAR